MRKSLVKGAVLAGIIVFVCNLIFWEVLPWHKDRVHEFTNASEVVHHIARNAPESGLYFAGATTNGGTQCNLMQQKPADKLMAHPQVSIFASVQLEGSERPFMPYVYSFILQILAAYVIGWLLMQTKGLTYGGKVIFVTIVGLLVAVLGYFPSWNWLGFPAGVVLHSILDTVIAWFLAGLVLAKLIRHNPKA